MRSLDTCCEIPDYMVNVISPDGCIRLLYIFFYGLECKLGHKLSLVASGLSVLCLWLVWYGMEFGGMDGHMFVSRNNAQF